LQEGHAEPAKPRQHPATPAQKTHAPPLYSADEDTEDVAVSKPQSTTDKAPAPEKPGSKNPERESSPATGPDLETLNIISDNLIDIAVYATMAMNRIKRGETDPRTLEVLCKKVRTQAVKTRRMANQLSRPRGK